MKQKTNKDLIIFMILIPVFLAIALFIQNTSGSSIPSYSIDNKSKAGTSVFFETLKELDYPVERSMRPLEESSVDDLQLVVPSTEFNIQSNEVKEWIEKGGTLVYFTQGGFLFINYGELVSDDDTIMTYEHGKGKIISANVKYISNGTLLRNRDNAYEILKKIGENSYDRIHFNETYLYMKTEQATLWSSLNPSVKFIFFQVIVMLIGFFYYMGRRFGKPIPLYEEVERVENEYLYSASSLYRHAGCWDLIAENYYKSFLKQMNRSHENWLGYWEEQGLPLSNKAKFVYEFMHNQKTKVRAKEYAHIVNLLEQLTGILNKRRDSYWKTLKTTQ
jgi:hypothetical protein